MMKLLKNIGLFVLITIFLTACSTQPKPIVFGTDHCDHCQMTISDPRFGAELVTKKGRVYKFDDIVCLKEFVHDGVVERENMASFWLIDFSNPEHLFEAGTAYLVLDENLATPMNSNIASFSMEDSMLNYQALFFGNELTWEGYLNDK